MTNLPIYRPDDRSREIDHLRRNAVRRGKSTGYSCIDEIFTLKKGYPLFIAGAPHHGKSQFTKQLLVNTSYAYGWKHLIYCGEDGTVEEITLDLIECVTKQPARMHMSDGTPNKYALGEADFITAYQFVNDHFHVLDSDSIDSGADFDVYQFYKWVDEYEAEVGIRFDTTLIDPWNDLSMNLREYGGRQDLYLADALKHVREQSKRHKRIDIVVNHIADTKTYQVTNEGRRFSPPALPSEWSGGQTWHRRAFTMILVYRPPAPDSFRLASKGEEIVTKKGETWIINQKVKPKGSGQLGMRKLYFEPVWNSYYELDGGLKRTAFQVNPVN